MNMTIGKKLFAGFGTLIVILGVIVIFSITKLDVLRHLQENGVQREDDLLTVKNTETTEYELFAVMSEALIAGYTDKIRKNFDDAVESCESAISELVKISSTDAEKEWSSNAAQPLRNAIDIFRNQMAPLLESNGKGDSEIRLHSLFVKVDTLLASSRAPVWKFAESIQKESDEANKTFEATARSIESMSIIMAIIALLIGITVALFITTGITRALRRAVDIAQEIAKGNLQINFTDRELAVTDETGDLNRSMKSMIDKLREITTFSLSASDNVSSGSAELSASAQNISQGSSEQAVSVEEISSSLEEISSAIEEVSSSIEEMTASINQNADNASQTEKIATKSSNDAKEGGEAVQKTVSAMKQIAEKISIIQEIARQTNLLSLNASIEAARAGEHGKGFAVVASAVQKLAERSQDAAEEISKLSKSSVDVAEKAGDMLDKLVPDIQKTSDLVAEINAASAEQNNGIKQVNTAVQQVNSSIQQVNTAVQQFNDVVQSNASASEELAATSEQLASQAVELKGRLEFFQIGQSGITAAPAPYSLRQNRKSSVPHITHATNLPHHPAAGKDKAVSAPVIRNDETPQPTGVSIEMGDDDDRHFQRT